MEPDIEQKLKGLSKSEVQKKVAAGQVNKYPDKSQRSFLTIILTNLIDLPNLIIFTSVVFLIIYQKPQDALLISGVIIVNNLVSIFQEIQARNSLRRINVINRVPVTVVREGLEQEIDPEELVVGDIIKIASGQNLFVDGRLLQSESLLIDESILTGESDYLKKQAGDEVFSGSFVVAGKGFYAAEKVGAVSFVNKITSSARKYINYLSPLQTNINRLVQILTVLAILTIVLLFTLNISFLKMPEVALVEAVVSIVTSTVPQGIVLTLTIAFLLGVIRMYQHRILVQKASAIETLAGIKVLCMDKTGTLTKNQLAVKEITYFPAKNSKSKTMIAGLELPQLVDFFAHRSIEQNKTIIALQKHLQEYEQTRQTVLNGIQILQQLPFTSKTKSSGISFKIGDESYSLLFGSPESLNNLVDEENQAIVSKLEAENSSKGWRNLIMLIGRPKKSAVANPASDSDVQDHFYDNYSYQLMAFISLEDALRESAAKVIKAFIAEGVKPVVISGDGAQTLKSLLKQLQVEELDRVISGRELLEFTSEIGLQEAILGHDVFARVTPEQKVQIIEVYQQAFGRVAMIGDGVNDALAIKTANLGISMGSGANVTKNIADVVLLDDNLEQLLTVIREGKQILFNTLRSAQLFLVKNYYSLVILVAALAFALTFPFTPRGLFLLAFLNGTLPILAVVMDQSEGLKEIHFMAELKRFVLIGGTLTAVISIALLADLSNNVSIEQLQTIMVSFLTLTGIVNALFALNKTFNIPRAIFGSARSIIPLITLGLLVAFVNISPINQLFDLEPLTESNWVLVWTAAIVYLICFSFLASRENLLPAGTSPN